MASQYPPDKDLFAFKAATDDAGMVRLSEEPPLLRSQLSRSALSGYTLPLLLAPTELAAFTAARAQGSLSPREDCALGCMLGMAVGDSIGAPFEFLPYRRGGVPASTAGFRRTAAGALEHVQLDEAMNAFGLQPGQWTDDTSMGLCLADSLLASNCAFSPLDLLLRFTAWWEHGYNNAFAFDAQREATHFGRSSVGLGGIIGESLRAFQHTGVALTQCGDDQSSGNGSIMRLAAVPILHYADEAAAAELARAQSYTTHRGVESAECAALMAVIIARAIQAAPVEPVTGDAVSDNGGGGGEGNERTADPAAARKAAVLGSLAGYTASPHCPTVTCLARSQAEPGGDPDRDWRWMRTPPGAHPFSPTRARKQPGYVGSYAMDALAMALHCVHATESFEGAVLLAANLRGDCDTVGAITGQIAGAIYGARAIPEAWVAAVEQWDGGGGIALKAHALFNRIPAKRE